MATTYQRHGEQLAASHFASAAAATCDEAPPALAKSNLAAFDVGLRGNVRNFSDREMEAYMSTLNPLLSKVFQGALDLNGPVLGRIFYLFEYARSHIEEKREAFDARFGTDTSAPTFEWNQKTSVHFYVPTTASIIYEILASLPLGRKQFTFVDMGSGKGRAVLIASEFPFSKIVGIELSKNLHRIAQANVKRYRPSSQQCAAVDLRRMDALDYDYGGEPLVLFLFDPFGRDVLGKVIANLEASLNSKPREAYVIYVYPQFEDVLKNSSILELVQEGGPKWQPWSKYVVYAPKLAINRAA